MEQSKLMFDFNFYRKLKKITLKDISFISGVSHTALSRFSNCTPLGEKNYIKLIKFYNRFLYNV